jgi:hypothetical protein
MVRQLCVLGFVAAAMAMPSPSLADPGTGVVRIAFGPLRSERGALRCALFDREETFLKAALKDVAAKIEGGRAVCEFSGLLAGPYAIAAFHDENGNGKLDTNCLGIPVEGIGASNDAHAMFGPPSFKEACFAFKGGTLALSAAIIY